MKVERDCKALLELREIPTAASSASKASRLSKWRYTAAALTPSPEASSRNEMCSISALSLLPRAGRVASLRDDTARHWRNREAYS